MEKKLRVYIAGSFNERFRLRHERTQLETFDYNVVANWLDHPARNDNTIWPEDIAVSEAERDFAEVVSADLVIMDTIVRSSTGGSDTELGIALARGKGVWIVGPYRTGFQRLATQRFDSWTQLYEWLRKLDRAMVLARG